MMLMLVGISPELTQAAYRVGDSCTNIITPMMPYFPLVVVFCQRYVKKTGIGTLVSLMLPYTMALLVAWSILLVLFWVTGLPLGQAAYESGYGTSRFTAEGNSLFGQWTYKGDGLKPKEQRRSTKGDHRIKAFDWPFDSVRGYFINLMSHPAYEDFRHLRAQLRAEGKPLDSLVLADGLMRYSERGQAYVDILKGMIRHNNLYLADKAVLRDEPVRFILNEQGPEAAKKLRADIEVMRASGELQDIIDSMRLD